MQANELWVEFDRLNYVVKEIMYELNLCAKNLHLSGNKGEN